jgi:hypothetical protein
MICQKNGGINLTEENLGVKNDMLKRGEKRGLVEKDGKRKNTGQKK